MNFPIKFLRSQIAPVLDRLNAGTDPLLNELVDTWQRSGRNHSRWKAANPAVVAKFERVTKLSADFDDTWSLALRVMYAPPKIQVERCKLCGVYFILERKDRPFCCAKHLVKFRTEHAPALALATKLASIPELLKNVPLDADWKSRLAEKGVSRWFSTRAQTNGYLNARGELTAKTFALFDHLRFPWQ